MRNGIFFILQSRILEDASIMCNSWSPRHNVSTELQFFFYFFLYFIFFCARIRDWFDDFALRVDMGLI